MTQDKTILKTSYEWMLEEDADMIVLDYDGWDRSNFNFSYYEEKISEREFNQRLALSTITHE